MEKTFCRLQIRNADLVKAVRLRWVWRSCSTNQSMMLVDRAAEKPSMLKLISVAVQRARPTMTGNRDRFTHRPAVGKING